MNIAMLGQKKIPSGNGGIEVVVEELGCELVRMGHSVTCLNRSDRTALASLLRKLPDSEYRGMTLSELFTVNRRGLAAVSASVSGAVRAAFGDYDAVHFHAEGPAFMCWLPKLFGKRTVVTVHGLDHQRAKWGAFASRYIMCGEKNAAKYADEIIVLSENLRRYFLERYHRETVYIPNGISPGSKLPAKLIKEKWGLTDNSYILFLGRLVPEKGIRYLIDAFMSLDTDKKLVIAGGSGDTDAYVDELKRISEKDERIIFTGFVSGDTKSELFGNAYVYALPSDVEGMPLSLLEALGYGCCCVTSDIPECTEVMKDAGVSFARGSTQALREKLQLLLDDPELTEHYKKAGYGLAQSWYSWRRVAEETERLYRA